MSPQFSPFLSLFTFFFSLSFLSSYFSPFIYFPFHHGNQKQVWFQNRRSKERRMKQLNTMAGRRHFFRSPRRAMRPLRPGLSPHDHHGLDDSPEMPGGPGSQFGYFPGNYNLSLSLSLSDSLSLFLHTYNVLICLLVL